MVEHRSPKPSAEGSSPSAPAKQDAVRMDGVLLGIGKKCEPEALGECRAASPSAAGGGSSEARLAQRSKSTRGHCPRRAFRAPQEGREAVQVLLPLPEKQVKTPTMPGKLGVTRPERVSQFTLGHPLNFPAFSPKSHTGWTRTLHQHLNIAFQGRIARQIWRRSGLFLPKNRRSENGNQRRSP